MLFYILEGANGTGKTTIINNFKKKGYDTLSSPNGTPLATFLRPVCRGTAPWENVDKIVKFLCFSAARYDEYIKRVYNNKENSIIFADRWWTSTYVYQVCLEGISLQFMEYTINPSERINKIFILTGKSDVLIDRMMKEREKNPSHGVCSWTKERETMKQIHKIYEEQLPKYLLSKNIPYAMIDTTHKSIEEVQTEIENDVWNRILKR